MIPCELILRNFMCYREDLPPLCLDGLHIACLSGENGAGKSALLDAITWAIWGKARMNDDDLIAQGASEMLVDLRFQLDGQRYRVIRQRKRGKSGTRSSGKSTLDFQMQGEMGWRPIGDGKIAETEKSIENVLRMKYDTFINASMLLQGRADEFTRKNPAERKQVLADILDLGEYATLEGRAKERVKKLHDEIKELEGIIGFLQQEAGKLDFYARLVSEAEAKAATLTAELETAEATRQEADAQVQALEVKQERRKQVIEELAKLRAEQQQQEQKVTELQAKIVEDEAILQRQEAIIAGVQAFTAASDELSRLDKLAIRYNELQERRLELREQYNEIRSQLKNALENRQREQQRITELLSQKPVLHSAIEGLERQLADLLPLNDILHSIYERLNDCDQRIGRANTLLIRRSELISQIKTRQESLIAVREEQQRIIESRKLDLKDAPRWRADLDVAMVQQQTLHDLSAQLATLREQEQAGSIRVGELRAQCTQFKQQADQIKKDRDRLNSAETTICPVCRSELGDTGIAGVLEHYDQEVTDLREYYRNYQRAAKEHETELAQISTQIRTLSDQVTQAQRGAARVETLQENIAKTHAWQMEIDQAHVRLADVQRQLETEKEDPEARADLRMVEAELMALAAEGNQPKVEPADHTLSPDSGFWDDIIPALERERDTLKQQRSTLEKQHGARSGIEANIENKRHQLDELSRVAQTLPNVEEDIATLTTKIEHGDFAHEVRIAGEAVKAELSDLGYTPQIRHEMHKQVVELKHWAAEERRLIEAQGRIESNRNTLTWAKEMLADRNYKIDQHAQEDKQLEHELQALPAARKKVKECTEEVKNCRESHKAALNDLGERKRDHNNAVTAQEQLAANEKQRDELSERQGVFQELVEAFGKKGVQAMLIETAIPEIEEEANRLLGRMTDNQMHLTFEMQREKKQGGGAIETLDIKIADALGTRVYDAFSGGEAMRVNFAIRVALSRLLARRAGASLETLVIDEGFGTLDAQGRERFVEAITSVQHDFKRILVITHLDELKERFPAQIEITKTAQGSGWTLV